jgi:hypothetical protein
MGVGILEKKRVKLLVVTFQCIVGPVDNLNYTSILIADVPRREDGHPLVLKIPPKHSPLLKLPIRNECNAVHFNHGAHIGDTIL